MEQKIFNAIDHSALGHLIKFVIIRVLPITNRLFKPVLTGSYYSLGKFT